MNIELTVEALNNTKSGISIGDLKLSYLLYAEDLVLLGNPEAELQHLLDTLNKWCRQWRIKMNTSKSKVIHYRPRSQTRTLVNFKCDGSHIHTVEHHRYLGVVLDEYLDFKVAADVLAAAGGRALGSVRPIRKHFKLNGPRYNTNISNCFRGGVCVPNFRLSGRSMGLRRLVQNRQYTK